MKPPGGQIWMNLMLVSTESIMIFLKKGFSIAAEDTNNRSKLIEKISKYENRVKFYGLFEHLGCEICALIKNCLSNHVTRYAESETFLSCQCFNLFKNSNQKRMKSFDDLRIFMLLHSWLKF